MSVLEPEEKSESRLELMKVVGASAPAGITTYPTEEAARASLGGTVPPNRRVLPYDERNEPTAAGANAGGRFDSTGTTFQCSCSSSAAARAMGACTSAEANRRAKPSTRSQSVYS